MRWTIIENQYILIYIYGFVALILAIIIRLLSSIVSPVSEDVEKVGAYECGFEPFDDARSRFDIRFYLVAIRFLVFDLEAMYRYPWSVNRCEYTSLGMYTIMEFVVELVIGYIYAWKVGALEWE